MLRQRSPFVLFGFASSACLVATLAFGQTPADLRVVSWTAKDGLPTARVSSIAEDDDGFVWLATDDGLFRFDGQRFLNWNDIGSNPLPENPVRTLAFAADRSLWVGLSGTGGVVQIRGRNATPIASSDNFPYGHVLALSVDDGAILAGGRSGLYRYRDGRWQHLDAAFGLPNTAVYRLFEYPAGTLWASTPAGLFSRAPGTLTFRRVVTLPDFLRPFGATLASILQISSTSRVKDEDLVSRFASDNGPSAAVLKDRHGTLWLGTPRHGLWYVSQTGNGIPRLEHVEAPVLSSNMIRGLFEDRAGDIWVATTAGLSRISIRTIQAVSTFGPANAVATSSDGSTWVATDNGVLRFHDSAVRRFTTADGLPNAMSYNVVNDARGQLWVNTANGLARYASGRFESVAPSVSLLARIVGMSVDLHGDLLLCDMYAGLFKRSDGQLTPIPTVENVRSTTFFSMTTDHAGNTWVGLEHGKFGRIRPGGAFELLDQGLEGTVASMFEDRRHAVWIGASNGLVRFRDGRFVTATAANGMPRGIDSIVDDASGSLWIGTNSSGVLNIDPAEFDILAADPAHRVRYQLFDEDDGLPARRVLGRPASARAADGKLWFVTAAGVAVLDPSKLRPQHMSAPVRIEAITADSKRFGPDPRVALPARSSYVQIEYTSPTLSSANNVHFRYRLDGFDEQWHDVGSRRFATYTNLAPGQYRFRVEFTGKGGPSNTSRATLDFSIAPALYQTWWFQSSALAAAVLIGWGFWQSRARAYQQRLRMVWAERARIGREIHDTLLQALVGAALECDSIALGAPTSLRQRLRAMSRELQEHVRDARNVIWHLRDQTPDHNELMPSLRRIGERLLGGQRARFTFTVLGTPRRGSPMVEEQILRIGQEAMTNAARHAHATQVGLELRYERNQVALRVVDDGCGFDDATAGDTRKHFGLLSMRERAENVGGRFELKSSPGRGTEVAVVLPLVVHQDRQAS